ncbi:FAD-dependent oxidoreductase [Microbacterium sp. USTB-Y]|uniref:FAD-dependent oxidoreductase n=1 Tax=Microbacterium sp. USTB-Y TaxID=2823692 RepID=UPI00203AFAC3|nr:FAD-dependent oxidoreductase [Microbacterium sp. USTB-Y]
MRSTLKGKTAIVIGGGWSGIAAAAHLRQAGVHAEIVDEGDRLGGRSKGQMLGDRIVTLGGKNIGKKYSRFRSFAAAHGGGGWEHFGISTSRIRNGRVAPLEGTRRGRATLSILARARPSDTIRLVRYARSITSDDANRYLDGPAFARMTRTRDRSLSEVFGRAVLAELIRPMTVRMNGAEPNEAYLGNLGTNLALVLDDFDQLTDGFEPVLDEFTRRTIVHTNTRAMELVVDGGHIKGVIVSRQDCGNAMLESDIVVLAVPAAIAADLVRSLDPRTAQALSTVPYHPVGVVIVKYDRDIFGSVGRALVFPEGHRISNAGAYGKNDLRTIRYTFSGRAARPLLRSKASAETLLAVGERELDAVFPISHARALHTVSEVWSNGLCSYGPDHGALTRALTATSRTVRGLAFAGDYVAGASIEACFVSAERATTTLAATMAEPE